MYSDDETEATEKTAEKTMEKTTEKTAQSQDEECKLLVIVDDLIRYLRIEKPIFCVLKLCV